MRWSFVIVFIVIEFAVLSQQRSTPESSYYTAAAVEYYYSFNTAVNVEEYLCFMKEASLQDVDVIVFPEISIIDHQSIPIPAIPGQRSEMAPCDDPTTYHDVLVQISCGAREYKLYVLINTFELLDCMEQVEDLKNPECGEVGRYEFVTNVVFDRDGHIIDKYRKKYMDSTSHWKPSPDRNAIGAFNTDFGVRFGHFICFDLMFQIPPVQIVQKYGITDILYSSMWSNDIPFLGAAAFHDGYARAFNINLIVSGGTSPENGNGGSGIYSGKAGSLISFTPREVNNTMLVSLVPKQPGQVVWPVVGPIGSDPETLDAIEANRDYGVPGYVGKNVEENEELQVIQLEDGNVTCTFHVQLKILERNLTEDMKFYRYRAVVSDRLHNESNHYVHTTVCCIVACTNYNVSSCGDRYLRHETLNIAYEFTTLRVTSNAPSAGRSPTSNCDDAVYYPRALTHELSALEGRTYSMHSYERVVGTRRVHTLVVWLRRAKANLLSFGVWGRIYRDDVINGSEDLNWF